MPALTQDQLMDRIDPKLVASRKDLIEYISKRRDYFQHLASHCAQQYQYDFAHKWNIRAQAYDLMRHEISTMQDLNNDPTREELDPCLKTQP